jgi:hypothetical protein
MNTETRPSGTAQAGKGFAGSQQGKRVWEEPENRFSYAERAMRVSVYNLVLFTHGYSKVVSAAVVTDDRVIRAAMDYLTDSQKAELHVLAQREWVTQVQKIRAEAAAGAGRGARWFTRGRRPAGSASSRAFAVLWFAALSVVSLAFSAAMNEWGPGPAGPLRSLSEGFLVLTSVGTLLLPLVAVLFWMPTWALSWARYGWGDRPRRYAALAASSALWCCQTLASANLIGFAAVVFLTGAVGFVAGTRADNAADAKYPPDPPRFAVWRAKKKADRLRRQGNALRAKQKAQEARINNKRAKGRSMP